MLMPPLIRKIEPGDVIGRCRIIRELGRGGVGTVYLATHQTLQIEVALKILSPALSLDNPALGERFIREAQLAARIRHPNVVAVMDAAHDEGSGAYFIVMEYIGGGSLSWHLRNGPLPEVRALAIVTGIAQALVIAEESRVVHRDIKPENIMLDLRGMPKLADLGLAKHIIDSRASITIGGSFMGTPAYMSPEQARDAKVTDTRDDIYSLGASFYECLTGVPPFQGETPYNIMSELLTKPSPRPRDLRPHLLESTDLVCRKMMAKDRELRYANARDLLFDLQHVQAHGDKQRDLLLAASFEQEADLARQTELRRETKYGIETSTDGVYVEPTEIERTPPRADSTFPPRRDRDVFGAAALLIALVLFTTLLLAWAGPSHPIAFFEQKFAELTGTTKPVEPVAQPAAKPSKPKEHEHVAANKPTQHEPKPEPHVASVSKPGESTPPPATNAPVATASIVGVPTSPVALPVETPADTNAIPATPAIPASGDQNSTAVPALPATSYSAFAARDIAERSLDPAILTPTGHAELLRIIGKRDAGGALMPTTWTFYFFDKSAGGHARIVTVSGGKVVKTGDDIVDSLTPYSEQLVLPEGQVQKDSTDVLQIAQALTPDVTLTGSDFLLLQQRNSVPMWKVKLWGKTGNGEERELGTVTLLAETGTVISNDVKP
jgi:serine/threonine protein kinase